MAQDVTGMSIEDLARALVGLQDRWAFPSFEIARGERPAGIGDEEFEWSRAASAEYRRKIWGAPDGIGEGAAGRADGATQGSAQEAGARAVNLSSTCSPVRGTGSVGAGPVGWGSQH